MYLELIIYYYNYYYNLIQFLYNIIIIQKYKKLKKY